MKRRVLLLSLLCALAVAVSGQYAATFSQLVDADTLRVDETLWLIGSTAGALTVGTRVEDAATILFDLVDAPGWLSDGERSTDAGRLAQMLLLIEETPTGFWYALVPTRFTALALLHSRGVLPAGWRAATVPSGSQVVDAVRRYFDYARAATPAGAR